MGDRGLRCKFVSGVCARQRALPAHSKGSLGGDQSAEGKIAAIAESRALPECGEEEMECGPPISTPAAGTGTKPKRGNAAQNPCFPCLCREQTWATGLRRQKLVRRGVQGAWGRYGLHCASAFPLRCAAVVCTKHCPLPSVSSLGRGQWRARACALLCGRAHWSAKCPCEMASRLQQLLHAAPPPAASIRRRSIHTHNTAHMLLL